MLSTTVHVLYDTSCPTLLLLLLSCSFVPTIAGLDPRLVETCLLNALDFAANKQLNNKMRLDFKVRDQGGSRDVSSFPVLQGEAAAAAHKSALQLYKQQKLAQAASAPEVLDVRRSEFDWQAVSRPGSSPRLAYVGAAAVAGNAAALQAATDLTPDLSAALSLEPIVAMCSIAKGEGPDAGAAQVLVDKLAQLDLDSLKKLMTQFTGQRPARGAKAADLKGDLRVSQRPAVVK
jgi:hypothetical protein